MNIHNVNLRTFEVKENLNMRFVVNLNKNKKRKKRKLGRPMQYRFNTQVYYRIGE